MALWDRWSPPHPGEEGAHVGVGALLLFLLTGALSTLLFGDETKGLKGKEQREMLV